MRLTSWLVALVAVLAVFVDIPKHQFSFPFNCPGVCLKIGDFQINQELKTHLGLDLQGGTQLILRLQYEKLPPGSTATQSELQTQAIRVIENRINSLGVSEPVIQGLGADLNPNGVYVTFQNGTKPVVHFEFKGAASDRWVQISKDYLNQPVQITLDGKEVSAPVIQTVFTSGTGIIEGNFTTKSANELAIQLKSGSLPVPLEVIQSSRVEPTLGRDSVNRSLVAGAIGLLLVAFFMIAYYRLPGAIAVLALLYYTALTYALFRLVPVTLTLAGIAGFILSIGMAVDANVLTFERLKEELRAGKSLRAAVEEGRRRAFPSILYSNLATIMTAGILFWFGTGTVKGFALTLAIGVGVSFFTAVIVTQMLLHAAIEASSLRRRRLYGVEEKAPDTRAAGAPVVAV